MELPNLKLSYPRVMMVSDSPITKDNPGLKRVVWAYNPRFKYAYRCYDSKVQSLEDLDKFYSIVSDGLGITGSDYFIFAKDYQEPLESIDTPFTGLLREVLNHPDLLTKIANVLDAKFAIGQPVYIIKE